MERLDICYEIGDTAWIDSFHIQLSATKKLFQNNLIRFSSDSTTLKKRQKPIQDLRKKLETTDSDTIKEINTLFEDCKKLEKELEEFDSAPKEWEKEGKTQILFTGEWSKPLNTVPFLLPATAIFKIYIFPFFAVILPLLAWILPFVIVRVFFKMEMPFEIYKNMIINMWLGGKPWASMDFWGQIRVVFQTAWTAFGLFQGINQPIQNAFHTKAIDDTIVKHGTLFQLFVQKVHRLFSLFSQVKAKKLSSAFLENIPMEEARHTYAYIREYSSDVVWIWRKLAEMELDWRLACAIDLNFAEYIRGPAQLEMKGFFDPSIPTETCVPSDIVLSGKGGHSLLTGPNKGGKSSTLRALCLNIWLAQTYGLVFAKSAKLSPFAWIRSGLRLADIPGSESLFEREVQFANKTLRLAASGKPGIVLYDECFHSTNPPDGEKTAKIFLTNLWKHPNTLSLVSTHVFTLVNEAPETIQRLCVPAEKTPTGISYSFSLSPGICQVSSVEEIYKKFGFPYTTALKV